MRRGGPPSQFRDFNEVTKGAEKVEGLFTLYTRPATTSTAKFAPISSTRPCSFP